MAFNHDGTLLASAGWDKTVRLWDNDPCQQIWRPLIVDATLSTECRGRVEADRCRGGIAFSPDGTQIAIVNDEAAVRLWDAATGAPSGITLTGHTGHVNAFVFNQHGTLLATASDDKTVRLWDPATGDPVRQPFTGHEGRVLSGGVRRDRGTLLASASSDATVHVWDVPRATR